MRTANTHKCNPPRQQTIERYYFEMFRKAYPLPPGEITYADKPDVLLCGTQKLGIEITNFYVTEGTSPASEQVQCKLRKTAVAEGHRIYRENGGENIELTFSFHKKHPIQNVNGLAKKLAVLARSVESGGNGALSRDVLEDIPELEFAYLYARELQYSDEPDQQFPDGQPDPSEGYTAYAEYHNRRETRALEEGVYKPLPSPARWKVGQGHDFGLMSTKRLTEIIRGKEEKARRYVACDAYWLLIIVDFIDAAQEQEIRIDGLAVESDVFRKIIVYKPNFEHVLEITPQPASAR